MIPKLGRRTGTIGLAFTAWDVWRRIPPAQRRALIAGARVAGPRIVRTAVAVSKTRKPPL